MRSCFHQQSLFKLRLHKRYYFELESVCFLNMLDLEGNSLSLYESDYTKLIAYLKKERMTDFTHWGTVEKLHYIERAGVRLTRYFSAENLKKYELDVKSTTESALSDIFSVSGTTLCKDGQQNCVVVSDGHIYIHPKVRSVIGPTFHEIIRDVAVDPDIKQGIIGVYHSSLSQGHQVSFAGSIVFDKDLGWTLDNTSGHYFPHAYQIKPLLIALQEKGMDLSKFMVKLLIQNRPGTIAPAFDESHFHIIIENAADYMRRMENSQTRYGY